jgi:hypothetical protein
MHSGFQRFIRPARVVSFLSLLILATAFLVACNTDPWPDREPNTVTDADADSLVFWPPLRYALSNDQITVEVHGLQRVYSCSRILSFTWDRVDSVGVSYLGIHSTIELPSTPECGFSSGLDTTFDTTVPAAGRTLYLRTPGRRRSDSLYTFAGTGVVEGFLHPRSSTDTLRTFGRFTFRDSTAGHRRRILYTDSLETCEVLQAATFRRLHGGDTLSIYFRTLYATPALSPTILPACAGTHSDTVEVVSNRYQFP